MKILDLYITKVCNLNCEYCYVDLVKEEVAFNMDTFSERVDLLQYDHIKFFWGEPLMKFGEIKKIISLVYSKKPSIRFTIVTNGLLLDDEILDFCQTHNTEVVVSIHKKWFKPTIKRLISVKKYVEIIWINLIFEESDLGYPYKIVDFLVQYGFIHFILVPEIYSYWGSENILFLSKELDKMKNILQKYKNVAFRWVDTKNLKILKKGCEKVIMNETWKISPCNRFKDLGKFKNHSIPKMFQKYDSVINFENDHNKWFYICPIGWYLDSLNTWVDMEKRIQMFKKLNLLFIDFFRKQCGIKKEALNILSQEIGSMRFNLTSQCNIRCKYCYVDFKNESLDYKIAANYLDFYFLQPGDNKQVSFFWWEPLLEFSLLEKMVDHISQLKQKYKKSCQLTIATNFLLVNKKIISFLAQHDFCIHISLNWSKKVNDYLRDNSTEKLYQKMAEVEWVIEQNKLVWLLGFTPDTVGTLAKSVLSVYHAWFVIINLEMVLWDEYIWGKAEFLALWEQLLLIKAYSKKLWITLVNTNKITGDVLDIGVSWEVSENSFDLHNYSVDFSPKRVFDLLIENIFNKHKYKS